MVSILFEHSVVCVAPFYFLAYFIYYIHNLKKKLDKCESGLPTEGFVQNFMSQAFSEI